MISTIDKDLAQQIVNTVKDVCGYDVNFINCSGVIFASTDEARIGTYHEIGKKAAQAGSLLEVDTDTGFSGTHKGVNLPVYHRDSIIAVIGISGEPKEVRKFAYLAERITRLLIREQEISAFSRSEAEKRHHILQSLLRAHPDNSDYLLDCLEEFGIGKTAPKRLIILHMDAGYRPDKLPLMEQKIMDLFTRTHIRLYTYHYPDEYLAVIADTDYQKYKDTLKGFAGKYGETLRIAAGKAVSALSLCDSYASALTALKSLAGTASSFADFDALTLELILSSLSEGNREAYFQKTVSPLSEADLNLLSVYFEEGQSLAKTAERLFLHKNTLQYKLDGISRKCGLNPRKFQDAVLLYLALRMKMCYTLSGPEEEEMEQNITVKE